MKTFASDAPKSVRWAVWLAVASVAIGLINTIRLYPSSSATISPTILVLAAVISTAFWAGLVYLFATGRNWARWIFVVIAFLAIPGALVSLSVYPLTDLPTAAISLSQQTANLIAAILLLLPVSTQWYRSAPTHAA